MLTNVAQAVEDAFTDTKQMGVRNPGTPLQHSASLPHFASTAAAVLCCHSSVEGLHHCVCCMLCGMTPQWPSFALAQMGTCTCVACCQVQGTMSCVKTLVPFLLSACLRLLQHATGAVSAEDIEHYKAQFAEPYAMTAALNYYRGMVRCSGRWT